MSGVSPQDTAAHLQAAYAARRAEGVAAWRVDTVEIPGWEYFPVARKAPEDFRSASE